MLRSNTIKESFIFFIVVDKVKPARAQIGLLLLQQSLYGLNLIVIVPFILKIFGIRILLL